jgi:type II restriction/modification system DNA methylase subunit YeeA
MCSLPKRAATPSRCSPNPAGGPERLLLYLALQALKDLEREAILWASLTMNTPMQFPEVGPQAVLGIELNSYAAELARVVIWIGEIQWMISNGFAYVRDPILKPLDTIEQRDAVLDLSDPDRPSEPAWPSATVIIGNPPFIGGKLMRSNLGEEYVDALFKVYDGRVPREADFVCYWHEKARAMVEAGAVSRVGLLATQGIRGGANRRVLERMKATGDIFLAWADEPWVLEGAAVHVSFVGFDDGTEQERHLDGQLVSEINADLTSGIDLTGVRRLPENRGIAFMGDTKGGPFDISADVAETLLAIPNPDGRSNRDVVRPWVNGLDVTRRPRNMWIIDFGTSMPVEEAALYEAPFEHVKEHVMPTRIANRRASYAERWWLHMEPRPEMRKALSGLQRYVGTPRLTKHRLFVWLSAGHAAGDPAPLHTHLDIRDVPVPGDPLGAVDKRRRGGGPRTQRPAGRLAGPARGIAQRARETDADQPLQRTPHLARSGARALGPGGARSVRLAVPSRRRGHARSPTSNEPDPKRTAQPAAMSALACHGCAARIRG